MKKWLAALLSIGLCFSIMGGQANSVYADEATVVDKIQLQETPYQMDNGWTVDGTYSGNQPSTLIKGNNEYIAVGNYGSVMKSKDGKEWTTLTRFANYQLTAIAWSGTHYVLAGTNTQFAADAISRASEIFISKDGLSWEKVGFNPNTAIHYLAYGNGEFIASGGKGVYRSTDGINWTETLKHQNQYYYHPLFFVNGTYFMHAYEENITYTSKDGKTWTKHTFDEKANIQDFIWFNGQYIGVSEGLYKSNDGIKWTKLSSSPKQVDFRAITTNDKTVVAMGYDYNTNNQIAYTTKDITTWTKQVLNHMNHKIYGIYAVADGFAGIAFNENNPTYSMYAKDGLNWSHSLLSVTALGDFAAIAYNGKRAVAVGSQGNIIYTDNGSNWKSAQALASHELYGRPYFFDIQYGANKFVAVGNDGIYTSKDGVSWTKNNSIKEERQHLQTIYWTGDYFIAAGQFQGVYYSKDGVSWKKITSVSNENMWLMSMVNDGKRTVAAFQIYNKGNQYIQFMQSTNGSTWTKLSTLNISSIELAYNGETFVAVDPYSSHLLFVSKDAKAWSKVNANLANEDRLQYITTFDGYFVAFNDSLNIVGDDYFTKTTYYSSKDGRQWKKHDVPNKQAEQTFGNEMINDGIKAFGKYIFVGSQGYIMYTSDLNLESPIKVTVHGKTLKQTVEQGKAFIDGGTIYLPLRVIGEALGYEIVWHDSTKTVTYKDEAKSETFKEVKIKNDLSYVPLRKVSEQLGYVVDYNKANDEILVDIKNK